MEPKEAKPRYTNSNECMNINMMSILIIRVNLIFRVSLTLFANNSLLDNVMNPVRKEVKEH